MSSSLWEPDVVEMQRHATVKNRLTDSPEKRLLTELLLDALLEFEIKAARCRSLDDAPLREVVAWFFSRDRSWPFSFLNVCEHLNLDPVCVRVRLLAMATECFARAA
jgi:hypothetical protein